MAILKSRVFELVVGVLRRYSRLTPDLQVLSFSLNSECFTVLGMSGFLSFADFKECYLLI